VNLLARNRLPNEQEATVGYGKRTSNLASLAGRGIALRSEHMRLDFLARLQPSLDLFKAFFCASQPARLDKVSRQARRAPNAVNLLRLITPVGYRWRLMLFL